MNSFDDIYYHFNLKKTEADTAASRGPGAPPTHATRTHLRTCLSTQRRVGGTRKGRPQRHRLGLAKISANGAPKKTARQHAPPCQVVVSMVISRTAARWSSLVHLLLPFFTFRCSFYFCNMKPTGTEKIILSGGAGPLAGWLALRISLESSPRAALIGPSSSSTIEARAALATATLFEPWG